MERGEGLKAAYQSLLDPGEQLREFGWVRLPLGGRGSESEPMELTTSRRAGRFWDFATRTTLRKVLFFTVLSPLLLVALVSSAGDVLSGGLERVVGGVVCVGPRGSTARRVEHALTGRQDSAEQLAITDRRLLLVRSELSGWDHRRTPVPERKLVLALPRREVAAARPAPRRLAKRRVSVTFADGSRIVLALSKASGWTPGRVVAALTT